MSRIGIRLDLLKLPFLHGFFRPTDGAPARDRIDLHPRDGLVYAIGDIHGCLAQLIRLEDLILQDAAQSPAIEKTIIVLGDIIDRGPDSAAVIEHLMRPSRSGIARIVLAGNHEIEMLAAFAHPLKAGAWLNLGGVETLRSYGAELPSVPSSNATIHAAMLQGAAMVPDHHLKFLRDLPVAVSWRRYRFVHAGCRPGVAFEQQCDADLVEIREPFLSGWGNDGATIVHGHTPVPEPEQAGSRIAVDTACYATGRLAAARIDGSSVRFMIVSSSSSMPTGARSPNFSGI